MRQRLTSGLPKPITAPCGSLTHLVPTQAPLPGHIPSSPRCTRWRSHAATWVSLMTPQRNAARSIAPKNVATFNTHTEALEPMAGALWTSYDASFPARWVEAMKKPSRAGGKPAKAQARKALRPKGQSAPKTLSNRRSAADDSESRGRSSQARVTRGLGTADGNVV